MRCSLQKIGVISLIIQLLFSCNVEKNSTKNRNENKSYVNYLSSIVNDTTCFEFPQFSVVDKNIYPVLDSVISLSEKCQYFDSTVKYLNSFRFGIIGKNDKHLYSIDAHLSPAQAVGLVLVETGVVEKLKNFVGIFYYRNYLFTVPSTNLGDENELKYFPFVKKTDKIFKIRAPKFFDEKVYSSYVTFTKLESGYKIMENKICGDEILIR